MAQKKKRSLWEKIAFGSEKSEGYARNTLPSNRWELFWDIFKGRFGKLIVLNLLILLFLLPVLMIFFMRFIALTNLGMKYPFMNAFGTGYQMPITSMNVFAENITLNVNLLIFALFPIAMMIASVGISGGAYVVRNMVWTEGIFVANDFWRGIKQNIKQIFLISLIYSVVFYASIISISLANQALAISTDFAWLLVISKILCYVLIGLSTIIALHMITMCVTYELKFKDLLKNSFMFTIALLPQSIFFIALGVIPFILILLGGLFLLVGVILVILVGFSLLLLVWTDFCQWGYDKFINERAGAKKRKGIYDKIKESDSGALKQYANQMASVGRSIWSTRPIKPITDDELKIADLPSSFNRADLQKLKESKDALYEDHAKYVEEHKNDPEFMLNEKDKELQKVQAERDKRIEKAKKELAKRNKK